MSYRLPVQVYLLDLWRVLLLTGHQVIGKLFQIKRKRMKLNSPRFALPMY